MTIKRYSSMNQTQLKYSPSSPKDTIPNEINMTRTKPACKVKPQVWYVQTYKLLKNIEIKPNKIFSCCYPCCFSSCKKKKKKTTAFLFPTINDLLLFRFVYLELPAAAKTPCTRFRWWQPVFSGEDYDQWAVDDIIILSEKQKQIIPVINPTLPQVSSYVWTPGRQIVIKVNGITNSFP